MTLSAAQQAWTDAQQQAALYSKALAALEKESTAVEARAGQLAERERLAAEAAAQSEADREELLGQQLRQAEAEQELAGLRTRLDVREKELNAQALIVEQGRLDAEAGFLEQERAHLSRLCEQRRHLLAELDDERKRLYADIERRHQELAERQHRSDAEAADLRTRAETELSQERADVRAAQEQLAKQERTLRAQAENHEEDQEYLREQARLAVAGQLKRLELDLDIAREEADALLESVRDLEQQREERDRALRAAGHEGPEILHRKVQALSAENEELRHKLATAPASGDPELLETIQREYAQCQEAVTRLQFDSARVRSENNAYRIAADEVEQLREHRDSLQHHVSVYKKLLADLQAELDGLISNAHAPRPFPGLDELDSSPELQTVLPVTDTVLDLRELADYVQQRILADSRHRRGRTPLAYRGRDIRCLLGGMAMSRLHILEGISGIGKTTFPKAFASAMGADYAVIEVQAGWHDRQDLIGTLNAFEHRYYEGAFTKAVYQAGCDAHHNRPFFIILDEMNLSHPEQYFADILSGLENVGSQLRLKLTNHPVGPAARLLVIDKGVQLPVPENVWFFGTSNQDETTVQFADKTYDRSNVIELPTTPPNVTAAGFLQRNAISHKALQRSFRKAWSDHRDVQGVIVAYLRENLASLLIDEFGIAWGPRLEQQVRDFAPVVKAAGGSAGEAADHILATRILRRLRGRYSLRAEQLQALRELIDGSWYGLERVEDAHNGPIATRALLDKLIAEKG